MARFFAEPSDITGDIITLSPADAEHIRALRLRPNELFTVCDGYGTDYACRLSDGSRGTADIISRAPSAGEPDITCTVYIAYAKGSRLEFAVQKSVELGAAEIVLFPSQRCISTPDEKSASKKIDRLQKIAHEAAKQCGRGILPRITAAASFEFAADSAINAGLALFFYELEKKASLKEALRNHEGVKKFSIFTGPEGGFDETEAQYAAAAGMLTVTLGPRILRCETAPVCALSAIMYHTGNL